MTAFYYGDKSIWELVFWNIKLCKTFWPKNVLYLNEWSEKLRGYKDNLTLHGPEIRTLKQICLTYKLDMKNPSFAEKPAGTYLIS